jgi:hypothetical protein
LSAGGNTSFSDASHNTYGATQDNTWNLGSTVNQLNQFIYGEKIIMKRGLFSGLNCSTSGTVTIEMNIYTATTNAHTLYITGMMDIIYTHDVQTGEIVARL